MKKKEEILDEDSIENLKDCPGIGETIISKLRAANFETLSSLCIYRSADISEKSGVGLETCQKITEFARSNRKVLEFAHGYETIKKKEEDREHITTMSKSLDELLGGGIETQALTEFYGAYGASKTQLAFQLCVTVQLPKDKGGLNGKAIFLDSEGTFRMERIESMSKALNLDPKIVFENIYKMRLFNSEQQILCVEEIKKLANKEPIRLLVIDSLTALFRSEFLGRGTLADRQGLLNKHIRELNNFAHLYNVAVVATNQVMANPAVMFSDPTTPVGGHIMGHGSYHRIYLRRAGKEGRRVARVVDSPLLPESEALFCIKEEGIRDADEK